MSQSGKPKFDYHISRVYLLEMGLNLPRTRTNLLFLRDDISLRNLNRNDLVIVSAARQMFLHTFDEDRKPVNLWSDIFLDVTSLSRLNFASFILRRCHNFYWANFFKRIISYLYFQFLSLAFIDNLVFWTSNIYDFSKYHGLIFFAISHCILNQIY